MSTVMKSGGKILAWTKQSWFIIAVLFFSFITRIYKIDANLPDIYWHDENNYIETALRFGTGNFRPHTFQHGMAFPLLLLAEFAIYYVIRMVTVKGYNTTAFLTEYVTNPTNLFLIGRVTAALFGTGCILLVYAIAIRLHDRRVANLAALFSSLSLVPLMESRYAKAEPVATFFILLAFLAVLPIFKSSNYDNPNRLTRYYILSGFLIGFATAVKLYAVFSVAFLFLAHLYACGSIKRIFNYKLALAALFLTAGFILGNPYILIDPGFFYRSISDLQSEMVNPALHAPWLLYFKDHLKNVVGSLWMEALILISCLYFIFKSSKKIFLLLAYPVTFYLLYMNYYGFAHYLIPAIPFLLIITAAFIYAVSGAGYLVRKIGLIYLIILLAITPCIINIIRYLALMSKPDTRTIAKDWIENNIKPDSSILSEGYISSIAIQVPRIKGNLATLKRDYDSIRSNKGRGAVIQAEMEIAGKDIRGARYNIFKTAILDVDYLKKIKAKYIILSSYVDKDIGERGYCREKDFYDKRKAFYDELEKGYMLIQKISPYPELDFSFPVFFMEDFKKMEMINLQKDLSRLRQGPEIKIYGIRR